MTTNAKFNNLIAQAESLGLIVETSVSANELGIQAFAIISRTDMSKAQTLGELAIASDKIYVSSYLSNRLGARHVMRATRSEWKKSDIKMTLREVPIWLRIFAVGIDSAAS